MQFDQLKRREFMTLLAVRRPLGRSPRAHSSRRNGCGASASSTTRRCGTPSARGCATTATWKVRISPWTTNTPTECPSGSPRRRPSSFAARSTSSRPTARHRRRAAKEATATIPIVMIAIGDPVRAGLVASIARPGGNVTGNTILGPEVGAKRLQLFKEAVPTISRMAFLVNPANASTVAYLEELQIAAPALGVELISAEVRSVNDFDSAFAAMMRERPDAFMMTADPLLMLHIRRVIDFLTDNRLPSIFQNRDNVVVGGLMSYGASLPDLFRRGAGYVHKILQGTKPADLPVEQPTKFELVINLKTAKALGLSIPRIVLAARRRGDRMKRREFITLLGGAAARGRLRCARSSGCGKLDLSSGIESDPDARTRVIIFRQRLAELGWSEDRNTRIEVVWGAGDADHVMADAADLIRTSPVGDRDEWPRADDRSREGDIDRPCGIRAGTSRPWHRGKPGASGRQHHRLHPFRGDVRGKMAGGAQGHGAADAPCSPRHARWSSRIARVPADDHGFRR